MNIIPQSSLFLGIIPALIILYISLKDWQDHYTEKTLFIMFILGIILGFIVVLIQLSIFYDLFIIILIFPFLEQIIKTMILNLRRFQAKQATVMYGLGFGLGFGSIYPPAFLILFSQAEMSNFILISTLIGSIGLLFIHGATGALIGYGIYQAKLLNFYGYAVLTLIGANLLMWIQVGYVQWITLLVGLFMFYLVHKKILLKIVKSFEKRKRNPKTSE
jgi:hypothetical protein